MKIALFSDTYAPQVNGVAKTLKRLIDHLEKRDVSYQLFVPDKIDDNLFETNIHGFTSLPFFLYPECRMALPNLFKIRQQLRTYKPDLIHITTPFNIGLSGLHYGKKENIPLVGSYHTHFDHYLNYYKLGFMSDMLWKYLRWFYGHFEETFVPSFETKHHLERRNFSNLSIWSRGVDCNLFNPLKKTEVSPSLKKFTLLYVGRLAPEKDLHILKQVMQQLPSYLRDQIHWIFVGDGPLLQEMQQDYSTESVSFPGYLKGEALASLYASADLFVFPSTTETFGNVVLEALASGTPAIVSNSGGVKEIVQHEKTGFICQAGEVNAFIDAIVKLLDHHENRQKMSYEARKYALTQTWESIFDSLLDQYESIANRKRKRQLA